MGAAEGNIIAVIITAQATRKVTKPLQAHPDPDIPEAAIPAIPAIASSAPPRTTTPMGISIERAWWIVNTQAPAVIRERDMRITSCPRASGVVGCSQEYRLDGAAGG